MTPIAAFLTDFRPLFPIVDAPPASSPVPQIDLDDEETAEQHADAIEAARQAGIAEGEAQARAAYDARIALLEAEHGRRLIADRQHWAATETATMTETLEATLAAIEDRVARSVADILEPMLPQALAARTVAALRETIGTLLSEADERVIRVSGPPDLLEALSAELRDKPGIVFADAETAEVSIVAGSTTIQSRMTLWAETLRAAIGAPA